MQQVIELNCPGCGARVSLEQKACEYCHNPIVISTFSSVNAMTSLELNKYANAYKKALEDHPENIELNKSIAMCFLKLKLYEKAFSAFEKAMEDNFEDSEIYFYAAIALLNGKKAFSHQRKTIDKILEYLNAAIMIEEKGIYYYFMAYIKYDYFARKHFITSPNYEETLEIAKNIGISNNDQEELFAILSVERPECL